MEGCGELRAKAAPPWPRRDEEELSLPERGPPWGRSVARLRRPKCERLPEELPWPMRGSRLGADELRVKDLAFRSV